MRVQDANTRTRRGMKLEMCRCRGNEKITQRVFFASLAEFKSCITRVWRWESSSPPARQERSSYVWMCHWHWHRALPPWMAAGMEFHSSQGQWVTGTSVRGGACAWVRAAALDFNFRSNIFTNPSPKFQTNIIFFSLLAELFCFIAIFFVCKNLRLVKPSQHQQITPYLFYSKYTKCNCWSLSAIMFCSLECRHKEMFNIKYAIKMLD